MTFTILQNTVLISQGVFNSYRILGILGFLYALGVLDYNV